MWQIITCQKPDIPFTPRPYEILIDDEYKDYAQTSTGWTYGHDLLPQYVHWGIDDEGTVWPSTRLRNVVAMCMEYVPNRRPRLDKLGGYIARALRSNDAGQDNDAIRQWSEDFFAAAPFVPDVIDEGDPMEL